MNQNPFAATAESLPNPWEVERKEVLDVAKESTLHDVGRTISEANTLASEIKRAKKEGNNLFLIWAGTQAKLILKSVAEFIRRAIELAIFKFVLELCAMAIKSLMEALSKRGYGVMDVSTKGVVYHGDNPAPQAGTNRNIGSNPFESVSYGRPW